VTDWAGLPKIELHLHLEGAAPPEFIRALADEQGVDLSDIFDGTGAYRWADFAGFLATYERACSVLRAPGDFRRLAEAVLARSAADGVIYTEIFLAPDFCGGGDPGAWREYLAAIIEGADQARAAHRIEAAFIPTAIRHFGPGRAEAAARLTVESASASVVGFGMGGEERFGHPSEYSRAYAVAAEAGLGLTVHAGEVCGPESIRAALDHLPVHRLGHGVRAAEDPGLLARLRDTGMVLEVCPGSNLALGLYPGWPEHPLAALREAGVAVTVSTDDPPYFRTDLPREYGALAHAFGWTEADFRAMNLAAADAAFCDAETRLRLRTRLEEQGTCANT
jgi:adenosine deaminase